MTHIYRPEIISKKKKSFDFITFSLLSNEKKTPIHSFINSSFFFPQIQPTCKSIIGDVNQGFDLSSISGGFPYSFLIVFRLKLIIWVSRFYSMNVKNHDFDNNNNNRVLLYFCFCLLIMLIGSESLHN